MGFDEWVTYGWLLRQTASRQEIQNMLGAANRSLADAHVPGISADARLIFSYQAALLAARAALAAAGFRTRGESHHFHAIQSLEFTVGLDAQQIQSLDAARKTRNTVEYWQAGVVSDTTAADVLALATQIRHQVEAWLRHNYPELM